MDLDPDLVRLHGAYILEARERAEVSLLKAIRDGAADPVVLLLDPDDPKARRIADAAINAPDHDRVIAEASRRGAYPVMTWGVPKAYAVELLSRDFPDAAQVILEPHASGGRFWIIVVAEGGASPIVMPPLLPADVAEWADSGGGGHS